METIASGCILRAGVNKEPKQKHIFSHKTFSAALSHENNYEWLQSQTKLFENISGRNC